MKRKPKRRNEKIQSGLGNFLLGYPLIMTIVAIISFLVELNSTGSIVRARTFVFLTIVFFELYQAFAARSTIFSSITVGLFKNKALIVAILISFIVSVGAVYMPAMNTLFGTAPLRPVEFLTVLAVSSLGFIYLEISKYVRSKRMGFEAGPGR